MEDQMSKRDWAIKDLRMAKIAVIKSHIEAGKDIDGGELSDYIKMIYTIREEEENFLPKA